MPEYDVSEMLETVRDEVYSDPVTRGVMADALYDVGRLEESKSLRSGLPFMIVGGNIVTDVDEMVAAGMLRYNGETYVGQITHPDRIEYVYVVCYWLIDPDGATIGTIDRRESGPAIDLVTESVGPWFFDSDEAISDAERYITTRQ